MVTDASELLDVFQVISLCFFGIFAIDFFEMCRRFSYGNYTWKNTFGKRGGGVLVVSNRIPLPRREQHPNDFLYLLVAPRPS